MHDSIWKETCDGLRFTLAGTGPRAAFFAMTVFGFLASPLQRMLPLYISEVYFTRDWSEKQQEYGYGALLAFMVLQGFYVYRERRLLVAGGWLGLLRPLDEHADFALARIRVDITNAVDREWKVDVRKSKAIPPPSHTTWLKGKAQRLQETARAVLRRRKAGGHEPGPGISDPVWHVTPARGSLTFRVNRAHPILNTPGLAELPPSSLEALLVALETSIPVALLANPTLRTTERKI
jgi:hypothetical protein